MSIEIEERLPIKYKGCFFRKATQSLILEEDKIDMAQKLMRHDKIKNLEINPIYFKNGNLEFIEEFDFIEGLSVISPSIKNISPIQSLKNLRTLSIDHKLKGYLNFNVFKKLEKCSFTWGILGSETIFELDSLDRLQIDKYDNYELLMFSGLKQLTSLTLHLSKIVNLKGVENLINLKKLDLSGCVDLENIKYLNELQKITELKLDKCKKISNLDYLSDLQSLIKLSFNDIGEVDSVNSLEKMFSLEELLFSGNTKIIDGDFSCLKNLRIKGKLKTVLFRKRKHYSHTPEDLGYKMPDTVARMFRS